MPLVKRDTYYGMMIDRSCTELVIVIPEDMKEKMSSGIIFQCMGVKVTKARLEAYNGGKEEFV